MSTGAWFIVASAVAALLLTAAGAACAVLSASRLMRRALALHVPDFDLERTQAALKRLQRNAVLLTALLDRARAALLEIDQAIAATIRVFSRE